MGEQPSNPEKQKNEYGETQPWLNQEREQAYTDIQREIEAAVDSGMKDSEYLMNVVNEYFDFTPSSYGLKIRLQTALTPERLEHVGVRFVTSPSLSELAGQKITRPVFVVDDPKVFGALEYAFDLEPGRAHGLHIRGENLTRHPAWSKVGILLSLFMDRTILHEMRHSVDPVVLEPGRTGYNSLLGELFAFYGEKIKPGSEDWAGLEALVGDERYFASCSAHSRKKISAEEWQNLVHRAIEQLKSLREVHGDLDAQRILVQAKTVDEFLAAE